MSSIAGELVTETFEYDGGRKVSVYVPPDPPEAVAFAGDGQVLSQWGAVLEAADVPSTMIVGVGLRHPDIYGAVFCASPGGGYRPPDVMPSSLPRVYLVAGTLEPFFHENATRWADALRDADADVVMTERVGSHGDPFWRDEFPLMVASAFER
jgi:hypothetical protein